MFRQFLFLTFILTQTFIFAQKTQKNQSEKRIWENDNNSLEIRFKALDEFYLNNHLQDLDSALIYVDYHLQLAKTHKKQSQLFEASKRKGNILRLKGLYPQAMRAYTKAEELAKILNNNIFIADILGNKGNVYIYQSDYIPAINNFSDALDIYKKIDHNEGINRMLTSLGAVFLLLQDYPKALEYFDLVKKNLAATKQVDRTNGILLINMGWANYKLSKWEEAQTCYFSGLDILLKENALLYVGELYLNLAVLYRDLNQYKKAFYYVNKSLELNLKFGVSTSILHGKLILAELISKDNPKKVI
jgi:tetratricopeptide (TPR) repeat protein